MSRNNRGNRKPKYRGSWNNNAERKNANFNQNQNSYVRPDEICDTSDVLSGDWDHIDSQPNFHRQNYNTQNNTRQNYHRTKRNQNNTNRQYTSDWSKTSGDSGQWKKSSDGANNWGKKPEDSGNWDSESSFSNQKSTRHNYHRTRNQNNTNRQYAKDQWKAPDDSDQWRRASDDSDQWRRASDQWRRAPDSGNWSRQSEDSGNWDIYSETSSSTRSRNFGQHRRDWTNPSDESENWRSTPCNDIENSMKLDSDNWDTCSVASSSSQTSTQSRNSKLQSRNFQETSRSKFPTNIVDKNEEKINKARNIQADYKNLLKTINPGQVIKKFRQEIHDIGESCFSKHELDLEKVSCYVEQLGIGSKQKGIWSKHHDILKRQRKTFELYIAQSTSSVTDLHGQELEYIITEGEKIVDKAKKEAEVFKRALPTYAFKDEIVLSVSNNQVTIISADVCYYASAVIPLFLESTQPNGIIISCLPNVAICKTLYQNCLAFMHSSSDSSVVCFETEGHSNIKQNMKILFTTNKSLFEKILCDSDLMRYSCAIISCPLKRTAKDDFLLEKVRRLVKERKDFKLVILIQPPQAVNTFETYFSKTVSINTLSLPDLSLPVSVMWKKGQQCDNFTENIIRTALAIHELEEPGDVLVFLPSSKDFERISSLLSGKLRSHGYQNASCLFVSEFSSDCECFQAAPINESTGRRFFFVTSWAEQVLFPTVSYVIDVGLIRDDFFDDKKCLDVERLTFISRIRAKVRKLSAGRLKCGKCYRLYNRVNYCNEMAPSEKTDIMRKNPSSVLVQMFMYNYKDVMDVEFVDPIPESVKRKAMDALCDVAAVNDGQLTRLGQKIVKLPYPPRLSKLIIKGIEWGFAFEVVVLAALFLLKENIFVESQNKKVQKKAEASKLQFLVSDSDTLTFLNVYRQWMASQFEESWCDEYNVSYKALCRIRNKVDQIHKAVTTNLKESIDRELQNEVDLDCKALQELIFDCYWDNLCVYSGHFRCGYFLPKAKCMTFLHPSSAVLLRKDMPQFVVFIDLQGSSRYNMINMTAIPEDIVTKETESGRIHISQADLYNIKLVQFVIEPVGIILIKNMLLGRGGQNLYDLEKKLKEDTKSDYIVIEPDVEKGSVMAYTLSKDQQKVVNVLQNMLQKKKEDLLNEEETLPLELTKGHLKILIYVKWEKGAITSDLKMHSSREPSTKEAGDSSQSEQESITCSIELSWLRRLCKGTGFLSFNSDAFVLARRLSMRPITIKGTVANVEVNKNIENQLYLTNLNPETMEDDIQEAVERACGVLVTKATIVREKEFKTTRREISTIENKLEDILITSFPSRNFKVVGLIPKDASIRMRVYVNFTGIVSVNDAVSVFEDFTMNGVKVFAKPVYNSTIYCSNEVFQALEKKLNKEVENLRSVLSRDTKNSSAFHVKTEIKDYNTVCLALRTMSLDDMNILLRTVHKLLEGKVISSSSVKGLPKIFSYGGHLWLNSLQHQLNIHILEEYKTKSLRLYGSENSCNQAVARICEFMDSLEDEVVKSIDLNNNMSGRALLKRLIKKYGFSMKGFIEELELRSAEIDVRKSQLILHGSPDSIEKALTKIEEIALSWESSEALLSNQEECCICGMPPLQCPLRLENCGHLYCIECLQGMIANSRFPISCCAESCEKELILEDLRKALNYEEAEIAQLLNRSMTDYISRNKTRLIYCPAPDCSMFFDKNTVTAARWKCPLCQNDICVKCNVLYHQGVTCEYYQNSKDDPDYSFKVWMKEKNPNCKKCPKCKTAIEKNQGCNHMTCYSCRAHFCWLCSTAFPNADQVYKHQPFCPYRYR